MKKSTTNTAPCIGMISPGGPAGPTESPIGTPIGPTIVGPIPPWMVLRQLPVQYQSVSHPIPTPEGIPPETAPLIPPIVSLISGLISRISRISPPVPRLRSRISRGGFDPGSTPPTPNPRPVSAALGPPALLPPPPAPEALGPLRYYPTKLVSVSRKQTPWQDEDEEAITFDVDDDVVDGPPPVDDDDDDGTFGADIPDGDEFWLFWAPRVAVRN
ncbi:hypothetical protein C8J55DRAFT_558567 [Lentinula edodes]|uniref:Uncharacterized protein n=1 Tax=Lentinula lateritia TaxID=40482 RepID=A0A9W9AMK6_9AGAR|nr:hypothetical protein C8J55DRAFT_558567 [Lentinula edodes]